MQALYFARSITQETCLGVINVTRSLIQSKQPSSLNYTLFHSHLTYICLCVQTCINTHTHTIAIKLVSRTWTWTWPQHHWWTPQQQIYFYLLLVSTEDLEVLQQYIHSHICIQINMLNQRSYEWKTLQGNTQHRGHGIALFLIICFSPGCFLMSDRSKQSLLRTL